MARLVFGVDTIESAQAQLKPSALTTELLAELVTFRYRCEGAAHKSCILVPADYASGARQTRCKLFAHCTVVAWAVQKQFSGDILHGFVTERGVQWAHSWNRLPCRVEIDLTSGQFRDGDGLYPTAKTRVHHRLIEQELWVMEQMKETKTFMRRLERVMKAKEAA